MKKIVTLLLCLLMAFGAATAEEPIRVYTLKGPTGMGMAQMMQQNDGRYAFTVVASPEEIVAAIGSGQADLAAVPTNLAAILYKKTEGKVHLAAVNTLGVLSLLEKGDSIHSIADLKGKTIGMAGQGATPEYVLQSLLRDAGIADQVETVYYAEHAEVVAAALAGKADVVLLPEPNVTALLMKDAAFRIALDISDAFEAAAAAKASAAKLTMGGLIVTDAFAKNHADAMAGFMADYAASVTFVNEHAEEAAQMIEAAGILPKAAVALNAIPNCHIVLLTGDAMQQAVQPFYALLLDANPKSIGGSLPDAAFYWMPQ